MEDNQSPIQNALLNKDFELVESLILTTDFSKDAGYLLIVSCEEGYTDIVKSLVNQIRIPMDPLIRNNYPFRSACRNGHTEVVKLLLEKFGEIINPPDDNFTIKFASESGSSEILGLLSTIPPETANRNKLNLFNYFAIEEAATHGHLDIIKLLCNSDSKKRTALFQAFATKQTSTAIYMLWELIGHLLIRLEIISELMEIPIDIIRIIQENIIFGEAAYTQHMYINRFTSNGKLDEEKFSIWCLSRHLSNK